MLLYIDPGTGSMIFSILIALATTVAFGARVLIMKLKFIIGRGKKQELDKHNRGIVIFTDDKRYWNVFEPLCIEAEKRGVHLTYLTQSLDDPALKKKFQNITTEFIGEGNSGIAKMNFMNADIVVSSTPHLEVFQWKRSHNVKYYVHVLHGTDDMLNYRMFALDFYDAVLLTGDFQKRYIRRIEAMRSIKAKELITVGYPPMDEMKKKLLSLPPLSHTNKKEKTILVAPSWGEQAILSKFGANFLRALVKTGYNIVVRPHPQTIKTEKSLLDSLQKEFVQSKSFMWNFDNNNFNCLNEADLLITDFSGIIFDFALVFDKPLIYAGANFDTAVYDAAWFSGENLWRFNALSKMGIELKESQFDSMKEIIDKTLSDQSLKLGRAEVRNEAWQHQGESAKLTVDYLVQKQKDLNAIDDMPKAAGQ